MQQKPFASSWLPTVGLAALAGGLAGIFNYLAHQGELKTRVPEFIALSLLAGSLYLIGVYLVEKYSLGPSALVIILGGAILFRLLLLPVPPSLSEDVYRYQWEGRVQRAKLNPYKVFPAMPGLAWVQDPEHTIETGKTSPTIYPPLSEITFSWVKKIPGYKRLFTAFDLASLGVLLILLSVLKQPLYRVLTYAWNPTVVVAFAMCGHHDSLAIFTLLVASLSIIGQRPLLSITFLSLSFLSKYFPALLLPVVLKRTRWAYAGIFIGLVILGYLPFWRAGGGLFKGLLDYATGWEGNDSLFRLVRYAGNSKAQAGLVAGALIAMLLIVAMKKRMEPLRASLLLTGGLLLLSPNAFPWYFTWSIPFLCFYPSRPWLLLSVTSVLGYAPVMAYAAGQPYRDSPFILALEYGPVLLWLAYEGRRAIRRGSGIEARELRQGRDSSVP